MDRPPVFSVSCVSDRAHVYDVVRAVLTTVFFHRLFSTFRPKTRDLLDLTLPAFDDTELESLIDTRTASLLRNLEASSSARGQLAVQFFEKRPKKGGWFKAAEEKVCWEQWVITVKLLPSPRNEAERARQRQQVEYHLQKTVMEVIRVAGAEKSHIPPITSNEPNPFPYAILESPKGETWGAKIGGMF